MQFECSFFSHNSDSSHFLSLPCSHSLRQVASSVHSSTLSILGAAFFTHSTLPTRRQGNSSHSWLKILWSFDFVLSAIRYTDLVLLGLTHLNPVMWHMNTHTSLSQGSNFELSQLYIVCSFQNDLPLPCHFFRCSMLTDVFPEFGTEYHLSGWLSPSLGWELFLLSFGSTFCSIILLPFWETGASRSGRRSDDVHSYQLVILLPFVQFLYPFHCARYSLAWFPSPTIASVWDPYSSQSSISCHRQRWGIFRTLSPCAYIPGYFCSLWGIGYL